MSCSKELFCISFDPKNKPRSNQLLPGQAYEPEDPTRYQAWAVIQDLLGHPYRIGYVQVNVIPGSDQDTESRRDYVRKLVEEALKDYPSLRPEELQILFVPPEPSDRS